MKSASKSLKIRPTTSRVRKVLMDTIAGYLPGASFLDLFAGTGSVGLEAINRGAASATFVEQDRTVLKTLRDNIEKSHLTDRCTVFPIDAIRFLKKRSDPSEFDIIFADPPYERGYLGILKHILLSPEEVRPKLIAIQVSRFELNEVRLPKDLPIRQKVIGDTVLLLIEGSQ
ncbi:MAG: RsmD family RNA methyltransferase [Candidatus Coatesbacteria bacterium]|nr:RsmD family RNA methyltransferase [Candidatus Coatesbacteria bacterium]